VRQAPGVAGDLRSDFGLVALKQRAADGTWRDVLPIRPVSRTSPDSAGPLLIEDDPATPEGRALRVAADGSVTVTGGFRRGDGRWARRGVRFVFRVVSCGVRLEWFAEPGDRYEYSVFAAAVDGRYSSGTDPLLARARLRLVQRRSGPQTVTTCAPDAP
jgi:hypothetical protein